LLFPLFVRVGYQSVPITYLHHLVQKCSLLYVCCCSDNTALSFITDRSCCLAEMYKLTCLEIKMLISCVHQFMRTSIGVEIQINISLTSVSFLRGPFENFMESPYYSESELCGGAMTVSFLKYLTWQVMHFLQRSTHFSKTCCRPFAAVFRRIVEQAVLTFHVRFSVCKGLPPFENRSSSRCIVSIGLMDKL
jgi:hypothetical protein